MCSRRPPEAVHTPVLAGPALEWLRVRPQGTYVDCTAGAGGHAEAIARQLCGGRLIALDRDPEAVERARERLAVYPTVQVFHRNYDELAQILAELGIRHIEGVLIDAGVSSMQLDDPARGFSFQQDGPLDMRMDPTSGLSAAERLAQMNEGELARVLRDYGDVGPAQRIARGILGRARAGRLSTTKDLRDAVAEALSFVRGVPDETRTVFQAIRILVNDELRRLEAVLRGQILPALSPEGRVVVITFHSGEDRIVKNVFRDASRPRRLFRPDGRLEREEPPMAAVLTPKPIEPDEAECRANPRAKSAKLRAAERLSGGREEL